MRWLLNYNAVLGANCAVHWSVFLRNVSLLPRSLVLHHLGSKAGRHCPRPAQPARSPPFPRNGPRFCHVLCIVLVFALLFLELSSTLHVDSYKSPAYFSQKYKVKPFLSHIACCFIIVKYGIILSRLCIFHRKTSSSSDFRWYFDLTHLSSYGYLLLHYYMLYVNSVSKETTLRGIILNFYWKAGLLKK